MALLSSLPPPPFLHRAYSNAAVNNACWEHGGRAGKEGAGGARRGDGCVTAAVSGGAASSPTSRPDVDRQAGAVKYGWIECLFMRVQYVYNPAERGGSGDVKRSEE